MTEKFTIADMYKSQSMHWSLEYQDFYHKTFIETIKPYPHNTQRIEMLKNRARNLLKKSPHYPFLKNHLFDFTAINAYGDEHFGWVNSNRITWRRDDPSIQLVYFYWFVAICIENGYGDDRFEFENDLLSIIDLIDDLREGIFPVDSIKYLRRELIPWLAAYRIICDAKYKLAASIDAEFWYCEPERRDPRNDWFSYYLPVNLDLAGGSGWPSWKLLMSAREKILISSRITEREVNTCR